jgi:excisionase family DNA binding protein
MIESTNSGVSAQTDATFHRSVALLTVADVAQQLKITRATVYGWIFRRILPHFKVGRFVRVDPNDLAEFLRLRRRGDFSSIPAGRTQTCPGRG